LREGNGGIAGRHPFSQHWSLLSLAAYQAVTRLSKDQAPEEGNGPVRRSNRPSKPSTRMMGPEWVVGWSDPCNAEFVD
jgi:hypothetical protein